MVKAAEETRTPSRIDGRGNEQQGDRREEQKKLEEDCDGDAVNCAYRCTICSHRVSRGNVAFKTKNSNTILVFGFIFFLFLSRFRLLLSMLRRAKIMAKA